MEIIYDLVVRFLGVPPKPNTSFTWTFKTEHGEIQSIPNLTPKKFYRMIVPHEHETKLMIINDPRHPETYYQSSFMEYSVNMAGVSPMKAIDIPVWFACDMGKCFDPEADILDPKRFDFDSVLGTDIYTSKWLLQYQIMRWFLMVFMKIKKKNIRSGEL